MLGIPVYLQIRLNYQQRIVTNIDVFENSIINNIWTFLTGVQTIVGRFPAGCKMRACPKYGMEISQTCFRIKGTFLLRKTRSYTAFGVPNFGQLHI